MVKYMRRNAQIKFEADETAKAKREQRKSLRQERQLAKNQQLAAADPDPKEKEKVESGDIRRYIRDGKSKQKPPVRKPTGSDTSNTSTPDEGGLCRT